MTYVHSPIYDKGLLNWFVQTSHSLFCCSTVTIIGEMLQGCSTPGLYRKSLLNFEKDILFSYSSRPFSLSSDRRLINAQSITAFIASEEGGWVIRGAPLWGAFVCFPCAPAAFLCFFPLLFVRIHSCASWHWSSSAVTSSSSDLCSILVFVLLFALSPRFRAEQPCLPWNVSVERAPLQGVALGCVRF